MFQIDLKSRKSIYEQVIDNVKELIVTGVLPAESKLPSVRELSKTLTVNPNTVQKAYRELEHQGYIYTVTGLGCFVAARNREWIREELLRQIETHLEKVAELAAQAGVSGAELCEMLRALREENEP